MVASDLNIELRGRIDNGAGLDIFGGNFETSIGSDIVNFSVGAWSEAIEDRRDSV